MKLETKFNINQRVFLMYDNEICNFKIIKVRSEVFIYNEKPIHNVNYDLLDDRRFNKTDTIHKYSSDKLFATKEELLKSL